MRRRRTFATVSGEPLDQRRDLWLAERIVERRALTRASGHEDLVLDLALTMSGYDFDAVWSERRTFIVDEVEIPVARLLHIVTSTHAGREQP